jgi:hypothetical protein
MSYSSLGSRLRATPGNAALRSSALGAVLRGVALSSAMLASAFAVACSGEEGATPDECEDLPVYDIREADPNTGAVQATGIVANSPLSRDEQRRLQQLASQGCVTLPHQTFSLMGAPTQSATSPTRGELASPER